MEEETKKYFKLLPIATEIYDKLYGKPRSHREWAEGFNIRGDITRILMKLN